MSTIVTTSVPNASTLWLKRRLNEIWENSRGDSLYSDLQAIINQHRPRATQEDIDIMKTYRDGAQDRLTTNSATRILHCVRCHALYIQGDMTNSCRVPHAFDKKVTNISALKVPRPGHTAEFRALCCDGVKVLGTWDVDEKCYRFDSQRGSLRGLQYCFVGTHTTNYSEVYVHWDGKLRDVGLNGLTCNGHGVLGCTRRNFKGFPGKLAFDVDFLGIDRPQYLP